MKHPDTKLQNMSILGSGWLGFPLTQHFLAQGYDVKASTRSEKGLSRFNTIKAQPFIIDIDTCRDLKAFLNSEYLIINITNKNLESFAQLIQQIERSDVKQVLFVSSTSVYGNVNRIVAENDNAELVDNVLFQIEQLFMHNSHFLSSIVRLGGLIGYSRHPGNFFQNGKTISQPDAPVNLIHRDDCISIISAIIEQDAWGQIFNACADSHPSKRMFYSHARQLLDLPDPEFSNDSKIGYKIVSNAKVKEKLNYQFIHPDLMRISFE